MALTVQQIQQGLEPNVLAHQLGITSQELIAYIQKNNKLPDEAVKVMGQSTVNALNNSFKRLNQGFTGNPNPLANLEVPEAQKNPQAYLKKQIQLLGEDNSRLTADELKQKIELLTLLSKETRGDFTGGTVTQKVDQSGGYLEPFNLQNYQIVSPIDTSSEIKSIQDLLSSRETKLKREGQLEQFQSGLQDELARGRTDFIRGEEDYARYVYENELKPRIEENLNVRGLLYSGDLATELARTGSGLQADIEQQALALQQEDDAFFQDIAYQNTFRKEIEAGNDVSSQLDFARNQTRTNQQQNFLRTQNDLRRRYQEQSYQKDLDRQLRVQEANLKRQQDLARKNQQSGLISSIGSTAGMIGGALIGAKLSNPVVGAQIGSQLGGTAGLMTGGNQ